jgi:hypothetical protein
LIEEVLEIFMVFEGGENTRRSAIAMQAAESLRTAAVRRCALEEPAMMLRPEKHSARAGAVQMFPDKAL